MCLLPSLVWAQNTIKIGVLSHRGDAIALKTWEPLAEYLSHTIAGSRFVISPLDFDVIDSAIDQKEIDFLLVNPGIYVSMEAKHRVSRIATLIKLAANKPYNVFGGVIFTKKNRADINTISDLKNKRFMAVDKISLGGYQMAWREMLLHNVNPKTDLLSLTFGGTHDKVVNAVKNETVDVGTVRTGILESMNQAGLIDINDFKIINAFDDDHFPAVHSTPLYPEWPFSKLLKTSNLLAQNVAIALFKLNDNKLNTATQPWSKYAGWTIPLEYQPINDILYDLHLPPYQRVGKFTLSDAINKYRYWLAITLIFIALTIFMMMRVSKLNRALKSSKKLLENQHALILDSVADGIYGVDTNGDSTFVNKAMEKITGWTAAEMVGKNQHEILHHTKKDGTPHLAKDCPVYKTYQDEKARFVEDDLFWKANGQSIPVEYSSTPLKDANAKTIGSVVVFRDISEKKHAEKQLAILQNELAHVSRLSNMGEMASGMAHELNQPLTAILTNSDACIRLLDSKNIDTERLMQTLEIIGGLSKRASGIIQQLRQFVKKDSGDLSLVNVNDLITNLLKLIHNELEHKSIKVNIQLDKNLPTVLAQPIQIDQVILNLVRNAIDAMESINRTKKSIVIKTETLKTTIKITVIDNGVGISSSIIDELFAPYKTTKQTGMGLGLSISENIIHSHHGQLIANNNLKTGASFSFTLPIKDNNNDRK